MSIIVVSTFSCSNVRFHMESSFVGKCTSLPIGSGMAFEMVEQQSKIESRIECMLEHIVELVVVVGRIAVGMIAGIVVRIGLIERRKPQERW